MLGNDDNSVHGKCRTAERQCLGNTRKLSQGVLGDTLVGQVSVRELVDVNRRHVDLRRYPLPAPRVSLRETVQEVLGVRMFPDFGAQKSDSFSLLIRPSLQE